jgi:hypothetical protein
VVKNEKIRLNLDISREVRNCLDDLQAKTQLSSVADVVRRALALLSLVVDNEKSGGKLVFRKSDGKEETLIIL